MNRKVCHLWRSKNRVVLSVEDCGVFEVLELVDAVRLPGTGTVVGPAFFFVGVALV